MRAVEEFQVKLTCVGDTAVTRKLPGMLGGVVSGAGGGGGGGVDGSRHSSPSVPGNVFEGSQVYLRPFLTVSNAITLSTRTPASRPYSVMVLLVVAANWPDAPPARFHTQLVVGVSFVASKHVVAPFASLTSTFILLEVVAVPAMRSQTCLLPAAGKEYVFDALPKPLSVQTAADAIGIKIVLMPRKSPRLRDMLMILFFICFLFYVSVYGFILTDYDS